MATTATWPAPRTVELPRHADELTSLTAYLDFYRETFELKCADVPADRMSEQSSPPSTMTLHGLARHLSGVERWWFAINFAGMDLPLLYYSDEDPEQDFEVTGGDPETALEVWREECDRSRRIVQTAASLDQVGARERNGSFSLRWVILRMIGEYARHNGHADYLREAIDGRVGE